MRFYYISIQYKVDYRIVYKSQVQFNNKYAIQRRLNGVNDGESANWE